MLCILMLYILMNTMIILLFLNHPLSMGFTLLMQVISISLLMNFLIITPWFSYILFLIMIGGMLILFIYMTSLASNEKFKFSMNLTFMAMIINSIMILMTWFFNINITLLINNYNFIKMNMFNMNLVKFFMPPTYYIIMMMIIYLLITLIAVVKITNFSMGPLRQKF
uniref:NADH dehydrogenase subunit 6 n=1 Tax=Ochthephilus sericinus TaxID=3078930 RepID=UPI002A807C47|nr:NADH dehydrogenase subunit 6 [Ochthephilus sericinus]WON66014.1 NADH dehydrogenase subunit 6 [Ochthephilus sericinus]